MPTQKYSLEKCKEVIKLINNGTTIKETERITRMNMRAIYRLTQQKKKHIGIDIKTLQEYINSTEVIATELKDTGIIGIAEVIEIAKKIGIPYYTLNNSKTSHLTYIFNSNDTQEWMTSYFKSKGNHSDLPTALMPFEGTIEFPVSYLSLCGIYFLCQDSEIVYVGQSVNIAQRINQHKLERSGKGFNKVYFILTAEKDLNAYETAFINYLKPILNKFSGVLSKEHIQTLMRIKGFDIEQLVEINNNNYESKQSDN